MTRSLKGPLRRHAVKSARITVDWRKGRIRRIKLEYGKVHLARRVLQALKW
jgi:hypothetical protein